MACLLPWLSGKETSAKKIIFSQGERLMKNDSITEDSSNYLGILDARFSNKFIFDDEREARSERNIGLFIKTRQDSTIRRK